jgi:hypothetical protein
MGLKEYRTTFVLELNSEDGEDLTMMVAMGFFLPVGDRYRMALPIGLTAAKVRSAVLRYALTEDENFMLHPERIVTATMPFAEATAWQDRLRRLRNSTLIANRWELRKNGGRLVELHRDWAVIDAPVNRSQRVFSRRNVDAAKIRLPWTRSGGSQ